MGSWDDGKHKNVKKIQVKYGSGRINSIKVDYESDGKLFAAPKRGGDGGDQLAQFELEKGEYLTAVNGYYTETVQGEVITSLKFQTNRRTYGPYGTQTRNYFSIDLPKDNQILGFYGSGSDFLSSLEAHIGPITASSDAGGSKPEETKPPAETKPAETKPGQSGETKPGESKPDQSGDNFVKLDAHGGAGGSIWDDGVHDNVRKIYVGQGNGGIHYIKFEYDKGGKTIGKEHGKKTLLGTEEFELQPDEYLVRIEGYYEKIFGNNDAALQSIKFVTNKGRTSPPFGLESGTSFTLENNGSKILGFHGRVDQVLYSLGAYFEKSATPLTPAVKLEAQGGQGGSVWDDGPHDTVKKIYIGQGNGGVQYVKFVYDKGGQTVEKEHGKKTLLGAEEFELQPGEYLVRIEGYYEKIFGNDDDSIQSIKFVTNKGRTSPPFGLESGTPFTLESNGSKILGFHGRVDKVLYSLGAYFEKSATPLTPAVKLEAQGGQGGSVWDDGVHDTVKKIYVGQGNGGVQYVKFEYEKGGQTVAQEHGKKTLLGAEEFELQPGEYLVRIEGYYEKIFGNDDASIQSIKFVTNKGRTSPPFGLESGTPFTLESNGSKILGFHGRVDKVLYSLGAYFEKSATPLTPAVKLEAQGGQGGSVWDDGVHDTVKKIYVGQGNGGVQYVKFEYEKGGQTVAQEHGKKTLLGAEEFELQPGEYLVRIEGYYEKIFGNDDASIQSIKFVTNKGRTSPPFGLESGTPFTLESNGSKILGFHGRVDKVLYSLGAYFEKSATPLTPAVKLEAQGGQGGSVWDDGVHDTVKKIYVGQGNGGVQFVKFEYEKGGQTVAQEHGKKTLLGAEEFELQPGEYLVRIEGYYEKIFGNDDASIQSIKFVTNKGRTSPPFGLESGTPFTLESNGSKILGFHGRVDKVLYSLGAYFEKSATPLAPATSAKKLEAQGGSGGNQWDDGVFDTVRKIVIGQGADGIQHIKFEYEKNGQRVSGQDHGEDANVMPAEFELTNPNEYLVSVEGTYDNVSGYDTPVIQSLTFTSSEKTSKSFGFETGTRFSLEENGNKIVGFHGGSSKVLHKLGAYVKPVTK